MFNITSVINEFGFTKTAIALKNLLSAGSISTSQFYALARELEEQYLFEVHSPSIRMLVFIYDLGEK